MCRIEPYTATIDQIVEFCAQGKLINYSLVGAVFRTSDLKFRQRARYQLSYASSLNRHLLVLTKKETYLMI